MRKRRGRRRGLSHLIRDAELHLPTIFTALDVLAYLRAKSASPDLQKIKWALKYLGTSGQLNVAIAGAPGQYGSVPKYSFREVPRKPEPKVSLSPGLKEAAKKLFIPRARPVRPEYLPHLAVENPKKPAPAILEGANPFNPNVPKLCVIQKRLETLRAELAAATLADAMSDQSDLIADLRRLIAIWERKEKLARLGEGQGGLE